MRTSVLLTAVLLWGCSSPTPAPAVTVSAEPIGTNCAAGGVKIAVGDSVQYACNGADATGGGDTPPQLLAKLIAVDGPGSMLDADTVDGHHASDFLYTPGTGISVSGGAIAVDPAVVQSRVSGTCPAGSAVASIAANGTVSCVSTSPFQNTIVVSAPGTAVQNGTALRTTILAASGTAARHTLVKIEPGTYDLAALGVEVPAFVDLEGSGEDATVLTANAPGGTLSFRQNEAAEVRSMTVISTYVGTFSVGISIGDASGQSIGLRKLTHLTVNASGGTMFNEAVSGGPQPLLVVDCTLSAAEPGGYGLFSNSNEHAEVYGSRLMAASPVVGQSGVVLVASSMLGGTTSSGATCAGCFDASLLPLTPLCTP